jgi:hypothetical protein
VGSGGKRRENRTEHKGREQKPKIERVHITICLTILNKIK